MGELKVQKVASGDERVLPVFHEADEVMARIRKRAFDLFAGRGGMEGHELEDWFSAEREICWPRCELEEHEGKYALRMALPGFRPEEISITATPREFIVHAAASRRAGPDDGQGERNSHVRWSEFESNDVYRRIELGKPVDVGGVSATLTNGLLTIVAEQATRKAEAVTHALVPMTVAA